MAGVLVPNLSSSTWFSSPRRALVGEGQVLECVHGLVVFFFTSAVLSIITLEFVPICVAPLVIVQDMRRLMGNRGITVGRG